MARVTVYDVAEKAGVSTATVSFAFRHPDKVKDDTKAKVLRVAEELGYVPSGNARSLAKGRTGTLGMYAFDMLLERPQGSNLEDDWPDVSPRSIDEPLDGDEPNVLVYPLYVDEVLRGFELECWKSGKGMLMGAASKKNDHRSVTDIAGRVDGLALDPNRFCQCPLRHIFFRAGSFQFQILRHPVTSSISCEGKLIPSGYRIALTRHYVKYNLLFVLFIIFQK